MPGAIKRMTIAVLVDDQQIIAEDGTITREARSAEELEVLTELMASASGLDEERGDTLTVRSLSFNQPAETDFVVKPSVTQQFMEQYLWSTVQALILAAVALILGLFVVRPLLTQKGEGSAGNLTDMSAMPDLLPMDLNSGFGTMSEEDAFGGNTIEQGMVPLGIEGPVADSSDPMDMLNNKASEQVDDAAELLANWLSADAKAAS
jgi:flagellar M-ring protein FliF